MTSKPEMILFIANSNFTASTTFGVKIDKENVVLYIQGSIFSHNEGIGLHLVDVPEAEISDCLFTSNIYIAVSIIIYKLDCDTRSIMTGISFFNNSEAISFWKISPDDAQNEIAISECSFINNAASSIVTVVGSYSYNKVCVLLEKSSFQGNTGNPDCSVLYVWHTKLKLSDVNITDNDCTGIKIIGSETSFHNLVYLARNHGLSGGGLYISVLNTIDIEQLTFAASSKLIIINNTAVIYGGGIYYSSGEKHYLGRETCDRCFFQFDEDNDSQLLVFSGNSAGRGGDSVFGGCLSHWCHPTGVKCEFNSTLMSPGNIMSQSTFVEKQRRARMHHLKTPYQVPLATIRTL